MKPIVQVLFCAGLFFVSATAAAYPPAVGIVGKSRSCTKCHKSNGPWTDESKTIVDILDAKTRASLRQPDGSYLIEVERGRTRTVVTVLGRKAGDKKIRPTRNAWLYVDSAQIDTGSLSKFAPGWSVNLPLSCRIVGDKVPEYPNAATTAASMTLRPGDTAHDAELELQIMLTTGKSAKGKPNSWLKSNYLVRKVRLKVIDI